MKWFIPEMWTTVFSVVKNTEFIHVCEFLDCLEREDCSNCIFNSVDKFNEFKREIESKND